MSITARAVSKMALGKRLLANLCALTFLPSISAAAASAEPNASCDRVRLAIGSGSSSIFILFARVLDAMGAACWGVGGGALVMGTLGCASFGTVVGFVANDTLGCASCVPIVGCVLGSDSLITLGSACFARSIAAAMRGEDLTPGRGS